MASPRGWRKHYALAVALAVIALPVRLALTRLFGPGGPYVTFFLAAAVSAALGGLGPGFLAMLLGVILSFFAAPHVNLLDPSDPSAIYRFLIAGTAVTALCGTLYSSRERARSAEARLRENERLYRAIGETIPFGIWICDADGRNTYASQSFLDLIGMTQEEYSNRGWGAALHADDAERSLASWKECVAANSVWDIEHRFLGKDGNYHPVLARGVPVRDDRGRTICWAGINLDIRRLKDAEAELERQSEELKRSNRELEQFAFAASHDLREPLRIVNIYSELLLNAASQPSSAEQLGIFAARIHQGADKLERLVRDLLAMSRVIHEPAEPSIVQADIALDQALSNLAPLIAESGARIERQPLPAVLSDEGQLTQVFQNLLSNAIKYRRSDVQALIRIAAQSPLNTPAGVQALFLVEDNGIGFRPEQAEAVFGVFKRLHGKDYEGTGIGLAICRRIVERYGGRIWAESIPGAGSKFFFTLRLASGAAAETPVHSFHALG